MKFVSLNFYSVTLSFFFLIFFFTKICLKWPQFSPHKKYSVVLRKWALLRKITIVVVIKAITKKNISIVYHLCLSSVQHVMFFFTHHVILPCYSYPKTVEFNRNVCLFDVAIVFSVQVRQSAQLSLLNKYHSFFSNNEAKFSWSK